MTLYRSEAVAALEVAQELLDEHAVALDGRCLSCGVDGRDCAERRSALAVFAEYGCLPQRLPGASRAHLRRVELEPTYRRGGFSGWLD